MKILKFGGNSLTPGAPLDGVLEIIIKEKSKGEIVVVVSAIADSTDRLLSIYNKATLKHDVSTEIKQFWEIQEKASQNTDFDDLIEELNASILYLKLGNKSKEISNQIVSIGERASVRIVAERLNRLNYEALSVDARAFLKCNNQEVDINLSEKLTISFFNHLKSNIIPVITGFITEDEQGNTSNFGRNGTNLTATLIASFINADEVQNWTNIDGIYSANPKYIKDASKIDVLSYREAHELANFGANILHPKTINPLIEKNIPLRILNSFAPEQKGTLINQKGDGYGIKAVSVIEDVSLITIEGKGLTGKIGIDARIFAVLEKLDISVRVISQASTERGIGFVIDKNNTENAIKSLNKEFASDIKNDVISKISSNSETAIIAIVGRHNYSLEKAIQGLRKNKIWLHLISNSITGEHISLVIDNKNIKKAVNVVYNQVFGVIKTINLFALGKGTVGSALLNQITNTSSEIEKRRGLKIKLIGVSDSKKYIINENGINRNWRKDLENSSTKNDINSVVHHLNETGLENIVIADNTTSEEVTNHYLDFLKAGFDLVASNKKANSGQQIYYDEIRSVLNKKGRLFYYETNVGAGLPIIDTIKHLYDSADTITKIRGVFSGSLSYIFNNYSLNENSFSEILLDAKEKGYTEPDPREDLNGLDVARKLIILAREIGLKLELKDIKVQNLIPEKLRDVESYSEFINLKTVLNSYFEEKKRLLKEGEVLRYVGELDAIAKTFEVKLINVDKSSPLGAIKNADAIFEIFTLGYGEQPIVVQGAGAGGEVTARGVYSDLIRIGKN